MNQQPPLLTRRSFVTAITATLGLGPVFASDAVSAELTLQWLGGPTMLIRAGDFCILTDPMLGAVFTMGDPSDPVDPWRDRFHRRKSKPKIDASSVDLVLLSHAHPDHVDPEARARLRRNTRLVLPPADRLAVAKFGFTDLTALDWGMQKTYTAGPLVITVTAVVAHHSRDKAIAAQMGRGNGYWIDFRQGGWRRTIYWTGDSLPTDDVVAAVRKLGRPDVLVPDMGAVGTGGQFGQISMSASDVADLTYAVRPREVIPIHHSTYGFYREPISALPPALARSQTRLRILAEGEVARIA
jgi:N-acyl-phosphatidylethanolamine-hydrolysing phospholipase D